MGRSPVETSPVWKPVVVARRALTLERAVASRPPEANREADADRESHRFSRAPLPFEDASVDPWLDARGDRPRAADSRDRCGVLRDERLHDQSLPNQDGRSPVETSRIRKSVVVPRRALKLERGHSFRFSRGDCGADAGRRSRRELRPLDRCGLHRDDRLLTNHCAIKMERSPVETFRVRKSVVVARRAPRLERGPFLQAFPRRLVRGCWSSIASRAADSRNRYRRPSSRATARRITAQSRWDALGSRCLEFGTPRSWLDVC